LEFIVSEIDIMSGGSNSLKPGQPRRTNINTVQTLLKAKLDSTKEKAPKKGRTHSQLSNDSNNSIEFDLSGLDHIQKDLEEIKSSHQGVTKITDLNEATHFQVHFLWHLVGLSSFHFPMIMHLFFPAYCL
jgi:hypothetical protein